MLLVPIIDQRVQAIYRIGNNITAAPAIAPVRTAEWHMRFTPETDSTGAAIAGSHIDFCLIEEFHVFAYKKRGKTSFGIPPSLRC
jgi:hypothetical protein